MRGGAYFCIRSSEEVVTDGRGSKTDFRAV